MSFERGMYMRCSACSEELVEGASFDDHDCHISDRDYSPNPDRETATCFPLRDGPVPLQPAPPDDDGFYGVGCPNPELDAAIDRITASQSQEDMKKLEFPDLAKMVREQRAVAADFIRERNAAFEMKSIWQAFQEQKMRDIYGVRPDGSTITPYAKVELPEEVTRALSIKDDVVSPDRSVSKIERVKAIQKAFGGLPSPEMLQKWFPTERPSVARLDPVLKAEACSFDEMIEAVRAKNKKDRHPMSDLKSTNKELAAKRARMGKSNYFDAPEVTDYDA